MNDLIYLGGHAFCVAYLREALADYGLRLEAKASAATIPYENREIYLAIKEGRL